jgi:hypothetical protein
VSPGESVCVRARARSRNTIRFVVRACDREASGCRFVARVIASCGRTLAGRGDGRQAEESTHVEGGQEQAIDIRYLIALGEAKRVIYTQITSTTGRSEQEEER